MPAAAAPITEPDDVARQCAALLRIDTSNPGAVEAPAAELVVDVLERAGCAVEVLEPALGRCSVVSRVRGREPGLPALVVHGHLDTVPARPDEWTHDPLSGALVDGCLWGRGALDMKGMVAMMLALQVRLATAGCAPRRDVVFAYFADEERGGRLGAGWAVRHRPELFAGAAEAIGEIGGFALALPDGRTLYPVQAGERAALWARVVVEGRAGHAAAGGSGSVERTARLVTRIADLRLDGPTPAATRSLRAAVAGDGAVADVEAALGACAALLVDGRVLLNPTAVRAGDIASPNVAAAHAELAVDCRYLSGRRSELVAALEGLMEPGMQLTLEDVMAGVESQHDARLLAACAQAIRHVDPTAVVAPFVLPASSDASHLAQLGIAGYGFSPLTLPPGTPYLELFHAADERVPVAALRGGARMLERLITTY